MKIDSRASRLWMAEPRQGLGPTRTGPCPVESLGGRSIDIVWGTRGQSRVALPVEEIEAARNDGHLVLLD